MKQNTSQNRGHSRYCPRGGCISPYPYTLSRDSGYLYQFMLTGTVPVIGLYEVKVGKLYGALNKKFQI